AVAGVFSAGHVRPHVEAVPLARTFQARQLTGIGEIANPTGNTGGRPAVGLEHVFDLPLDVEPPHGLVRPESQRLEWNLDLRRPAVRRPRRGCVPDAIPVAAEILRVVRDLTV